MKCQGISRTTREDTIQRFYYLTIRGRIKANARCQISGNRFLSRLPMKLVSRILPCPNFHRHKGTELDLDLQTLLPCGLSSGGSSAQTMYENKFLQYTLLIFESKNINYKYKKTPFYYFLEMCGLLAKFYFHFL